MEVCLSSSSYLSVFWLVGSFPSGTVASHSFHCCMSATVFLATYFKYCSRCLPMAFFSRYCSFKDVYYKLVMPNYMPYPWVASIFLKFLKVIFLLSPFKKLHHSLFYMSILFLTVFSSSMFQMHLRPFLHIFVWSMLPIHKEQHYL